jgi:carbon-monoxide dehydrogenase medium subunit
MTDIQYLAPKTLDEAGASWLAAPICWCRCAPARCPGLIVDIKKIAEMTAIEETADGGFRIGAAVSGMRCCATIRASSKVWPGVSRPST